MAELRNLVEYAEYCSIGQSKMFPPWKMFRAPPQRRRRLGQPVRRTPAKGISLKALRLRGRAAPSTGRPTNRGELSAAVRGAPWAHAVGHQTLSELLQPANCFAGWLSRCSQATAAAASSIAAPNLLPTRPESASQQSTEHLAAADRPEQRPQPLQRCNSNSS